MRTRTLSPWLIASVLAFVLVPPARAGGGWSDDPAVNLSVADGTSDQILPKLAFNAPGTWVSWFDGIANGFDVRVQLLDYSGNEAFAHNGVLVADRSFSSVQDYGFDAVEDAARAVVAFRDDRFAGTQITAAAVSATGTLDWGANGVQLTNTTDFVASPKIAATSNGIVVAWTQESSTHLQKLDANGVPQWTGDVVLTPVAGSYSASDLHAAGSDVILSFVHQTGGFGSPRHILAQKFDTDGTALWGAAHVAVFDGGSIQLGNFPTFSPDGSGGGVFSWYSTSPLQCFVQHILSNGTEAFAHDGVAVSTNATRVRVSPAASLDESTGDIYAFWEEQNSLQSQSGLYGQKIDPSGNRLTPEGVEIVSLSATQITMVRAAALPGGAFVYWCGSPSFGQDRLFGAGFDASGTIAIGPFDVASTASGKSRLVVGPMLFPVLPTVRGTLPEFGYTVLAWSDDRVDDGDVLAQPVRSNGDLGVPPATAAPETGASSETLHLAAYPNPLRGSTRLDYAVPGATAFALRVHDVTGRLVRSLPASSRSGSITWDGTDSSGAPVAAGVYFVRLNADGIAQSKTLIVVR